MVEQVARVYFGKAATCCCGCAGRYHDASNKAMVTKAVKRIEAALADPSSVDLLINHGDDPMVPFVSVDKDGRMTTVYYAEDKS
jgi:hypothetical protein